MKLLDLYNGINDIDTSSINRFISTWKIYINNEEIIDLCLKDAQKYNLSNQILPLAKKILESKEILHLAYKNFLLVLPRIMENYTKLFGESEINIVLYFGLCNGAGWVTKINNQKYILFGLEKIAELRWESEEKISNLIAHELGHIYQFEENNWEEEQESNSYYQLFIEGFAEYTATLLSPHSNSRGYDWIVWCNNHLHDIKYLYLDCLLNNKPTNKFFGDWHSILNHSDLGYYLGQKFIEEMTKDFTLKEIAKFDRIKVKEKLLLYLRH